MPGSIEISQLKHIESLTFNIPGPGVHLLTGTNGAGKTSVLACLRRIGQPNAFAHHFAASLRSLAVDNFEGAQITYRLDQSHVTYAYGGERWVPRPRKQNKLLERFGYPSVFYIGATAERITPRAEDFNPKKLRPANQELRDAANGILGTQKFDNLKIVNVIKGVGNQAFVLQRPGTGRARYYSERNFSLGELCVLKLVRALLDCPNNSLVLIDEIELALHPRAQVELLTYLTEMAERKLLTVIVSTHSASLVKRVNRNQILFLENAGNAVQTIVGCYPTYVLGGISYDEERAPDVVLYVEDEAACHLLSALCKLFISNRFNAQPALFPTVKVVPIGPFISVVRFLDRGQSMLPLTTRSFAVLDNDVMSETVAQWNAAANHTALAEFQRYGNQIDYLPWTPEVGLVEFLSDPAIDSQRQIREHFSDNRIVIRRQEFAEIPAAQGSARRSACKNAVGNVADHVSTFLPNVSRERVRQTLLELFAAHYFQTQRAVVMQLLGPKV